MTIKTVLVANRGEIARRIFRTAKSMGIVCIAVYTDADSNEPFVKEADTAIRLSTNYLDQNLKKNHCFFYFMLFDFLNYN